MNQHKGLSRISSDQNTLTFQLYMELLATKIMFLSVIMKTRFVPRSSPAYAPASALLWLAWWEWQLPCNVIAQYYYYDMRTYLAPPSSL